jgi:Transglycosylase SLT domain
MTADPSNAAATPSIDPSRARVAGAIRQAANTTGTSFEYLLTTAKMESDFNPTAGASTSSAHGLYQFIDQTWLSTVKEAGAQLGYGKYADAITQTRSGDYTVSDPKMRAAIMKLRDDPAAASSMAAALTNSNSFQLTGKIGRRPTDAELYMAHFMGVGGAAKLITNAEDNPQASGARLFPNAARANRAIFYDKSGRARSVSEVYSTLTSRYASAANAPTTMAMAAIGAQPASSTQQASATQPASATLASAAPAAAVANAAYLSSFPVTAVAPAAPAAAAAQPTAAQPTVQTASAQPTDPIFRSLFQAGDRSQPVSPAVQELWANASSPASPSPVASVAPAGSAASSTSTPVPTAPQGLDLFSDRNGIFSS